MLSNNPIVNFIVLVFVLVFVCLFVFVCCVGWLGLVVCSFVHLFVCLSVCLFVCLFFCCEFRLNCCVSGFMWFVFSDPSLPLLFQHPVSEVS